MNEGFAAEVEGWEDLDAAMMEAQLKQFESLINETDQIMMGYKIDKESNLLSGKVSMTTLPGSEMAKRLAGLSTPGESEFTGFLNDKSAFDSVLRYQLHPEDVEQYVALLETIRQQIVDEIDADGEFTDEELATIETATNNINESLKATLEAKVMDSGGMLVMDDKSFSFVAGSAMAETAKFEEAIKSLSVLLEAKAEGVLEAKFNSGTYDDITFHTITATLPEDEEEVIKMFGRQMEVILGVAPDKVYMAVGKDALTTLTDAIERSKTPVVPENGQLLYNIRVAPMLRFASGVSGEDALADMATTLETNETGRISFWSKPIPNGVESNFEIQDGIFALIKEGFDAYQQGAFQNFDDLDEF